MDPHRVRYVTQRFAQLQGLRRLPLAALFLISAMWRIGWVGPSLTDGPLGPESAVMWFVAGLAAAVILSFVIRAWYTKTFGFVSQSALRSGVLPLAGISIGFVISLWSLEQWQWPVPLPAMFVAAVLLWIGVSDRAARKHYIAVAFVWFALVTLASFGVSDAARDAVLDLAIALSLVIAGVGDHRLLRQTLQPLRETSEA
jgi:hypothetical protein